MATEKNWDAIKEMFDAALERTPAEREVFLQERCSDSEVRAEVERLLSEYDEAGGFLSNPAIGKLRPDSTASVEDRDHEHSPAVSPGTTLGFYRIQSPIGAGGMGEVFRALDTKLDREVALKILPREVAQDPERLARFRSEAKTLAQLDHPNIVTIYSVEESNGVQFLTMQLVRGVSLDRVIPPGGLPLDRIVSIGKALCDALAAAHERGIVHRDLKPANVMVTQDGQTKVLDFGIAKNVRDPISGGTTATWPVRTGTGVLMGTPAYMSPEQVTGRPVDQRTDIFCLGVILHEMGTGSRPFVGASSIELMSAILRDPPRSFHELRPDVPAAVEGIIQRCLEKDPERRFPTARALGNELQGLETKTAGAAFSASRNSTQGAAAIRTRRRRSFGPVIAAAVILIVLGTLGGYELRRTNVAKREPSVAVIGFRNIAGDPQYDWLGTALSESLTSELGGSRGLHAVPSDDVATVKTELSVRQNESLEREDLSAVRAALGTNYLLLGRYAVAGEPQDLDLNVVLQDSRGKNLADIHESGLARDYRKLISDASAQIAEKMGTATLSATQVNQLENVYPALPEASHLYFEALDKLRSFDAATALSLLKKARDLEPDSISIHWALQEAWAQLRHDPESAQEARQASVLASRTLLPQEYVVLAQARAAEADKQWDAAIDNYKSLFALFPQNLSYGLDLALVQIGASKPADALATLDKLTKLPPPVGTDPRIETTRAKAYGAMNDYPSEVHAAEAALSESLKRNARLMQARAQLELCWAHRNLGHVEQAYSACNEAQNLFSAFGDNVSAAVALNDIATWLSDRGRYADAKQMYDRVIQIHQAAGAQRDLAGACVNAAKALDLMGKSDDAEDYIQRAIGAAAPIGDRYDESLARILRGEILAKQGKPADGEKEIQRALTIAREDRDQSTEAIALSNLAQIQSETNTEQALGNYRIVLRMRRERGEKAAIATGLANMGEVLFRRGDLNAAEKSIKEALGIDTELKNHDSAARDETSLAEIELERGNLSEAEGKALHAIKTLQEVQDLDGEQAATTVLIRILVARKAAPDAAPYVQRLQSMAGKDRENEFESRMSLAEYLIAVGKPDDASRLLTTLPSDAQNAGMNFIALKGRLELVRLRANHMPKTEQAKELASIRTEAKRAGFGLLVGRVGNIRL